MARNLPIVGAARPLRSRPPPADSKSRSIAKNMGESDDSDSTLQRQLPTALQLHILALLPPNERALSGRLVCRDAFCALADLQSCTVSLGQPLPPHAVPWAVEAGQQYARQLPFRHKLQLQCTAAASGSEVNLEVAWAVLQPSVFPEMLQSKSGKLRDRLGFGMLDPGVAAIKAGHPQVLGWLLQYCPALLRPWHVLNAAARHCNLETLQAVWEAVQHCGFSNSQGPRLGQWTLDKAAKSATPDAVAKMEWLLGAAGSDCRLQESTALAAAQSGDLGRLQWLQGRGCAMGGERTICSALEHADLTVVQWLVDQAGCSLPQAGADYRSWHLPLRSSVKGRDGVAKLQWLQERGAPPLQSMDRHQLRGLVHAAACGGRVEVVQHLVSVYGSKELLEGPPDALKFVAQTVSAQVAQRLHQLGLPFNYKAYGMAACYGNLDMFRWLVQEGIACVAGRPILVGLNSPASSWPDQTAAHARNMLEAVQLLVGDGVNANNYYTLREDLGCAAARGSLALVRCLLGVGHPEHWPDAKAVDDAVEAGCEELLEWMAQQPRGLVGQGRTSPYIVAGRNGDRATLAALRRLGVPWGQGAEQFLAHAALEGCEVPVLRWLVEQGAPVGTRGFLKSNVRWRECLRALSGEEADWLLQLHWVED